MSTNLIIDPAGWEAYCENCDAFRPMRLVRGVDAKDHHEYHELLCTECASILLTYQRMT
jgi:hypothetical protein